MGGRKKDGVDRRTGGRTGGRWTVGGTAQRCRAVAWDGWIPPIPPLCQQAARITVSDWQAPVLLASRAGERPQQPSPARPASPSPASPSQPTPARQPSSVVGLLPGRVAPRLASGGAPLVSGRGSGGQCVLLQLRPKEGGLPRHVKCEVAYLMCARRGETNNCANRTHPTIGISYSTSHRFHRLDVSRLAP